MKYFENEFLLIWFKTIIFIKKILRVTLVFFLARAGFINLDIEFCLVMWCLLRCSIRQPVKNVSFLFHCVFCLRFLSFTIKVFNLSRFVQPVKALNALFCRV